MVLNKEKYKLYIKEQDLSQKDIAILTGLSEPSVSRLIAGKTKPRLTTAIRIARALNVRLEELFILKTIKKGEPK